MKKKIITILLCGVILLVVTGCEKIKNEFEIGEKSDIELTDKGISLSVKEDTLTNTGATLTIKNNSDTYVEYDDVYEIEIKQDGEWHKINVELIFNMPSYSLEVGESKEIEITWENGYGKLASGDYRIIKNIDIKDENKIIDTFYVAAEFTIK